MDGLEPSGNGIGTGDNPRWIEVRRRRRRMGGVSEEEETLCPVRCEADIDPN